MELLTFLHCWIFPSINMAYSSLFKSFFHQKRKSECESHSVVSNSLWPRGLYSPWNSPGQNTGVGSLSLLQGIFLTQELNWGLPHSRQILYRLSYQGSPKHQFFTLSLLYGPALTSIHESESHPVMTGSLRRHGLYSPRTSVGQILEWVALPFSSGSSQPREWTQVSCIAGIFFTSWGTREVPFSHASP